MNLTLSVIIIPDRERWILTQRDRQLGGGPKWIVTEDVSDSATSYFSGSDELSVNNRRVAFQPQMQLVTHILTNWPSTMN
jgi:hypothetical protein